MTASERLNLGWIQRSGWHRKQAELGYYLVSRCRLLVFYSNCCFRDFTAWRKIKFWVEIGSFDLNSIDIGLNRPRNCNQ